MRSLLQTGHVNPRQPAWIRWAVLLCVLLMAVMSTAQVCHTHIRIAPTQSSHPGPDAAPDNCPLCIAMHSALPATLQTAPEPVLHMQALDCAAADAERLFRWRFQLASRPPPGDTARA